MKKCFLITLLLLIGTSSFAEDSGTYCLGSLTAKYIETADACSRISDSFSKSACYGIKYSQYFSNPVNCLSFAQFSDPTFVSVCQASLIIRRENLKNPLDCGAFIPDKEIFNACMGILKADKAREILDCFKK